MSRYYSDNPIRDAEQWLNDQLEEEQRRPVCHECENTIWGEKAYEIGGELYCQHCRDDIDIDPDDVELIYTEELMEGEYAWQM